MYMIYSDGSALGNPGPGGYGVVVKKVENDTILETTEYACGFPDTTNNKMELLGAITGLESLPEEKQDVVVITDSSYVVNAFNEGWLKSWIARGWLKKDKTPVKNIDLWKRIMSVVEKHNCTFSWVKGHAGHPENERCDYLANSSAQGIKFRKTEDGLLEEIKED